MSRRTILLEAASTPVLVGLTTLPASAGPGLSGRVDFSRPLFLQGRISAWRDDRLQIDFIVEAIEAEPEAMFALASDDGLLPMAAAGTRLRIEVDPLLSRRLRVELRVPAIGDEVRLIARCRISADAQRGVWRLLAMQDAEGRVLSAKRRGASAPTALEAIALD